MRGGHKEKPKGGAAKLEDGWQVLIPDAHPGYIDWKQFAANQAILERNGSRIKGRRPGPRQGWALLSSRVLCGRCGGRMFVHYAKAVPKDGPEPTHFAYYTCRNKRPPASGGTCQSVSARLVDPAVTREILDAVREEHIAVALAVQEEVRRHASEAAAARKQRLRQLEYQADLAAQRYYAVDPLNRTVAARLESDWNSCMRSVDEASREHECLLAEDRSQLTADARQRIDALARDFSRIWHAPQTSPADRKRILGTILNDVTLRRTSTHCQIGMRFYGGGTREVKLPLPSGTAKLNKVQPELVQLVVRLSTKHDCEEVAAEINRRGHTSYHGRPFSVAAIRRILRANGVPSRTAQLRARGFRTAREVARAIRVSQGTVRNWAERGLLHCEVVAKGPKRSRVLYAVPDEEGLADLLRNKGGRKG